MLFLRVYMLAFESKDRTEPQPNSNATSKKIILCINIKIMAINLGNKSQEHTNLKFSRRLSVGESISHKNQKLE